MAIKNSGVSAPWVGICGLSPLATSIQTFHWLSTSRLSIFSPTSRERESPMSLRVTMSAETGVMTPSERVLNHYNIFVIPYYVIRVYVPKIIIAVEGWLHIIFKTFYALSALHNNAFVNRRISKICVQYTWQLFSVDINGYSPYERLPDVCTASRSAAIKSCKALTAIFLTAISNIIYSPLCGSSAEPVTVQVRSLPSSHFYFVLYNSLLSVHAINTILTRLQLQFFSKSIQCFWKVS